jgi:hypothetical protein
MKLVRSEVLGAGVDEESSRLGCDAMWNGMKVSCSLEEHLQQIQNQMEAASLSGTFFHMYQSTIYT